MPHHTFKELSDQKPFWRRFFDHVDDQDKEEKLKEWQDCYNDMIDIMTEQNVLNGSAQNWVSLHRHCNGLHLDEENAVNRYILVSYLEIIWPDHGARVQVLS